MNKSKKTWSLLLLLTLAAALLAGCASNADTLSSPTPGATQMNPMASPDMTENIMTSPGPDSSVSPDSSAAPVLGAGSIATLEDAKRASEQMEDALEKLTEVKDAYVVPLGEKALVGLEMDAQYQGEVDERLKKMVLARVQTVNKTVTGVAVTADPVLVKGVEALADTLEGATSLSAVSTQLEEMLGKIQVYTE